LISNASDFPTVILGLHINPIGPNSKCEKMLFFPPISQRIFPMRCRKNNHEVLIKIIIKKKYS
jgi:hypothetical protein